MIWEYALGDRRLHLSLSNQNLRARGKMSLLQVCRQIHTETALLPYQLNTFVWSSTAESQDAIEHSQDHQRGEIKKITMCMGRLVLILCHLEFLGDDRP